MQPLPVGVSQAHPGAGRLPRCPAGCCSGSSSAASAGCSGGRWCLGGRREAGRVLPGCPGAAGDYHIFVILFPCPPTLHTYTQPCCQSSRAGRQSGAGIGISQLQAGVCCTPATFHRAVTPASSPSSPHSSSGKLTAPLCSLNPALYTCWAPLCTPLTGLPPHQPLLQHKH